MIGYVGLEIHTELVITLRRTTQTGTCNDRVVVGVTRAGHTQVISPRFQPQLHVGVVAVIIVVPRNDLSLHDKFTVLLDGRFSKQRQGAVQQAGITQPLGNGLGTEKPGCLDGELVEVDVVTFGTVHVPSMYQIVVPGKDTLGQGVGIDRPVTVAQGAIVQQTVAQDCNRG